MRACLLVLFVTSLLTAYAVDAQISASATLDPTRSFAAEPQIARTPLAEEYLWTAGEVTARRPDHARYPWNRPDLRVTPHLFRARFNVKAVPARATLYLAGPREAHVFLNGHPVADFVSNPDTPIGFHVFHVDAAAELRRGGNVLAIEAVRGRGIVSGGGPVATQQLTYGEVLSAKLVPASFGVEAKPLLISDQAWRSAVEAGQTPEHWTESTFDDSAWPAAASLGPIESNPDFFQWSADAGMYAWPGYQGMSATLRTGALWGTPTHIFAGAGRFVNLVSIAQPHPRASFVVDRGHPGSTVDEEAPSLLLDMGREVAGRVLVESASSSTSVLSIAYGESEIEALSTGIATGQQGGNYLGTTLLEVPPNGVARGPKSGFRYVRIRFLQGAAEMAFQSIRVEAIYYPVTYVGSFNSSDPLLNRIWETGAYTAHLCMQEGIWDAVKRDRGRWVGDLDIEGPVILDTFGDRALIEQTLRDLVPADTAPVNGIPSYSALWVTSLAGLYQRTGDLEFLRSQQLALLHILSGMDRSLSAGGLFENNGSNWLFVDWSPGLYAFTPEARLGTQMQYARAYREAVPLLQALGDTGDAARYDATAKQALIAVESFRDPKDATYGRSWQLNALGTLLDRTQTNDAIWLKVLSHVKQDAVTDQVISPYFNAYLLDAMAAGGHRREALDWLRTYWGGMLAEGATSFWESCDLRWPKDNPHLSLQADGTSGYFVSLAHGWSSGPTAWIIENVLGVKPASPGYKTVSIRPDLLGLENVNGSVPTPYGVITVHLDRQHLVLDLPPGITQTEVAYHPFPAGGRVVLDGVAVPNDSNAPIVITQAGHHVLETR